MDIHGLQKMTLLDYPGKVACTVFLAGCDLHCPFCHNSELIGGACEPVTDSDAFLRFLEKRRGLLEGVAITGGEPLLRNDIDQFLLAIKALGYPVKLDTNGNHPDALSRVIARKLVDYVAMDVKNSPERYAETCGLAHMDLTPIRESVQLLLSDTVDYEFRTTVVRQLHDEGSFLAIGQWIKGAKRYFLQPFTDRDTVLYDGFSAPDRDTMNHYASVMLKQVRDVQIRGL